MATLPSILPSGHASCHRELIYPCALFIDTCTCTDHTHAHATALTDWHRPSSASPCFSSSVAPHLHLFMEKVTVATWPAIWRGPARYPKQAKHNPITPQGDTPHLLNSAWVIFGFSSGTCKDPLKCLWSAGNKNHQMSDKFHTSAAFGVLHPGERQLRFHVNYDFE